MTAEPITAEARARIKELLEKATPGPWNGRLLFEITPEDSDLCDALVNAAPSYESALQAAEARAADNEAAVSALSGDVTDLSQKLEAAEASLASADESNKMLVEIADACDRRAKAAEAKIAELQEALKPFIQHYEAWMDKYGDEVLPSTYSRHTIGDLRRARAALSPNTGGEK